MMKQPFKGTLAFLFAAAILIATSLPAAAAFTWYDWSGPSQMVGSFVENPPSSIAPGQDITAAYYATNADYRYFRMDLKGAPDTGSNSYAPLYQFVISTTSGFSFLNTYTIPIPTAPPILVFASGVIPTSTITEWYFRKDNATPNVLEWAVKRTDLPDTFAWQAFTWNTASVGGPITGIFDLTAPALATPVPSAALLLGTGIIGLIGLRRRSARKA